MASNQMDYSNSAEHMSIGCAHQVASENLQVGKKVLVFIPTLTAGGSERVASIIANEWANSHQVVLVTYFDEPPFFALDKRILVRCLGLKSGMYAYRRTLDVATAAHRLRRIVNTERPDFVLSFMNKYNAFVLASLVGTGYPVIVSERDSPTESLPLLRVLARDWLYPLAAGLICQTKESLDFVTNRTRIKSGIVIPNPVSPIIALAERRPEKIVLGVGRFVEKKAMDHLIRAFALMDQKDWSLVLCGDGPLRADLERLARDLRVVDRIKFAGMIQDLRPFYRSAGVFGFTSMMEGFPNALAEAIVSGLPSVSYDCPTGPAELIKDGHNGRLIALGDWKKFADAMSEIIADSSLALKFSRNAAEMATHLDPKMIANRFMTFCATSASKARQR